MAATRNRCSEVENRLREGHVIPALPLTLDATRRWSPRLQGRLLQYYREAGAGGLAIGVHTTQFTIREPQHNLLQPLLEFASQNLGLKQTNPNLNRIPLAIAGVCGRTPQAIAEARLASDLGFDAGLLSLAAWRDTNEETMLEHCRIVGEILPIVGFYLQPAVGGRVLSERFWRRLVELESLVAIKIAPFHRYQTLDVLRAVADSGRWDLPLYTGNDDHILLDLLTPSRFRTRRGAADVECELSMVGGLLGQWAVWTRTAVVLHQECRRIRLSGSPIPSWLLVRAQELTDANGAIFDVAHDFRGCIAGIHEILRRQGLMETVHCLDPAETLSPGQAEEIARVCHAYPHLTDDDFVRANRDRWRA